MSDNLEEYLKQELRNTRKRPNPFNNVVPIKIDRDGNQYVESIWLLLNFEYIKKLHQEIDKEERDFNNILAARAEIDREDEVYGKQKPSWFYFDYHWGF